LYEPIIVYLSGLVPKNLIPFCKWKPIKHCFANVIPESHPTTMAWTVRSRYLWAIYIGVLTYCRFFMCFTSKPWIVNYSASSFVPKTIILFIYGYFYFKYKVEMYELGKHLIIYILLLKFSLKNDDVQISSSNPIAL
jgi:hypothetical protein